MHRSASTRATAPGCRSRRRSSCPSRPTSSDVLNPSANQVGVASASASPFSHRLTVARLRPHVTVVGLGPAGTDLLDARRGQHWRTAIGSTSGRPVTRQPERSSAPTPSTISTRLRPPSTRCTPGSRRHSSWRRSPPRPSPSSTRCPARRSSPSAPSSSCAPTDGSTIAIVPALSFLDLAWAALGHRPTGRGRPIGRRHRVLLRGGTRARARSWWRSAGRRTCSRR